MIFFPDRAKCCRREENEGREETNVAAETELQANSGRVERKEGMVTHWYIDKGNVIAGLN